MLVGAHLCAALFATEADAIRYDWTGTGHVWSISAIDNGVSAPAPTGAIHLDDEVTFTLSFTTEQAELTSFYDADPTINLYWLHDLELSGNVGTFTFSADHSFSDNLQLWNYSYEDAQIVSAGYPLTSDIPFDGGPAMSLQSVGVFATGPADVRSSDLLSEILPLSDFPSKFLALNFYNPDTRYIVQVFASYDGQITATPTPEPSAWTTMLVGFAGVGGALRARRSRNQVSFG